MKIKQIVNLLIMPMLVMGLSITATLIAPSPSAKALTKSEQKKCYEQWAGRSSGTAGDGKKYNEETFLKSKCATKNKGTCKITRYEDGSSIWCKNKNGTFVNGNDGWAAADPADQNKDETEDDGLADPVAGSDCGGVDTAIIKCSQDNSGDVENNGVWGLMILVLNILTAGVGIVAVGGIVYGAVLYTTAEDKADQVKSATDIITNVVIGLIAFALMWAGLNFIVPGGVFN